MFISKQKYILILVFLLFPSAVVYSAWSEPTQAPTGGNAAVPLYSEGLGQTLTGTLHVDPTATNPTSLQGSGSTNGVQGNSVGNALFGNLSNNAAGGGRAVYGLAVDAADYGLYTSGGLGMGVASGDIWFLQQDQGIAWPRESDGASLYGVYVTNTGELQMRGHGSGVNVMDQNLNSRLTVAEAGAVNVVTGPLTVGGTGVCLASGANCPPPPAQNPNYWDAVSGTNDIEVNKSGAVRIKHDLIYDSFTGAQNTIDFDPWQGNLGNYFLIKSGWNPSYGEKWHVRVNRTGETLLGSNLFVGTGGGVAGMTPYNDPAVNASWKIGRVGGVNTIEATPGGGVASVGDINLKSGTLKLKYLNSDAGNVMVNDALDVQYGILNSTADNGGRVWINDELKVQNDLLANSKAAFGGYTIDPAFTVTTPNLWSNLGRFEKVVVGYPTGGFLTSAPPPVQGVGFVNAEKLCIQGACIASWADAGVGASKTLLQVLQAGADASTFIGPTTIGGIVNLSGATLNGTQTASNWWSITSKRGLQMQIDSDNNEATSFNLNNGSGQPILVVEETGRTGIGGQSTGYPLHVFSDGSTEILSLDSKAGSPNYWTGLRLARIGSEKWYVGMDNLTDNLLFRRTGAANDMIIDTAGNIGIGQVPPANPNDVKLVIKPANGEEGLRVVSSDFSPFVVRNAADSADLLRVDQTGKIGIGMVPTRMLEIKGDTGGNPGEFLMTLQNINANNGASLALITPQAAGQPSSGYAVTAYRRGTAGGDGWNVGMGPADNIYRVTSRVAPGGNTDRLVIDPSSGLVTLGTLKVTGGAGAGKVLTSDAAGLASWLAPAGAATLQAVTTAGNTTNLGITAATLALTGQTFDANDLNAFYLNGNGDVQIRIDTNNNGANQFKINNGNSPNGTTVFSVNESGVATVSGAAPSYCIGTACKTGWGPNTSVLQSPKPDVQIPAQGAPAITTTCQSGYVMIGLEVVSSALSRLVCARMW